MCYVLKERNGKMYLKKDFKKGYVPTFDHGLAETFHTKKQADLAHHSLCTGHKKRFNVYLVKESERYMFTEEPEEKSKLEDIDWSMIADKCKQLEELQKTMNQIKSSIDNMTREKDTYIEKLYEQLRIEDLSIQDCTHCIEKYCYTGKKLNAVQICKWFKLFFKHLKSRREIKNKIDLAKTINDNKIDYKTLSHNLEYQKSFIYEYKVLTNLEEQIGLVK